MFNTDIVGSDIFLEMPSSTQSLYFHLGMYCDDDGFVYPKKIMRMIGGSEDDLKILLAKKFLLFFDKGVVVMKHWRVNNKIRSDRYHPTPHRDEMALLSQDKGMVYHLSTAGIPKVAEAHTEVGRKVGRKGEDFSKKNQEENAEKQQVGNKILEEARKNLTAKKILKP